jgi:HK97 family phage prohead protease
MPIEYKSLPQFTMGIEDRTVTGCFCVHGNVDSGDGWTSRGDRSHPGLFGDFTVNGRKRAVFLWQHRMGEPPIATIDRLFEIDKADLPAPVRLYAPDATGGVGVSRTYLDTPRGNEVLAGLKAGAITEMSYAYDLKRWDYEEEDGERLPIRNLYESDLLDVSDVNLGMNPATSADGSKTGLPLHLEHATVLAAVRAYTERLKALTDLRAKEGRVLSGENRKRIETAIEALADASTTLNDLLVATEPAPKAAEPQPGALAETRQLYVAWQAQRARLRDLGVAL